MSDPIRETSPMITADALRKINQMNKAFYDTHTKKNFGITDTWGSQYSGTVENFGFESLLETRKLKMEKPSLEGVFVSNGFKNYFNLQYSNMIETYDQQTMIEAVLKKDTFLPNKEYTIKFVDCKDVYIPRSESWGALNTTTPSNVYKNKFVRTKTPPKLIIKDLSSGVVEEVDLTLGVGDDFDVDYYFYNEFATQKFIMDYSGNVLITVPISNDDAGLPFVWICEEIFRALPPLNLEGAELVENKPFLSIGTDGHNISHIYPIIYGERSLPSQPSTGVWYLKAWSNLDGFSVEGSNNNASKISSIALSFVSSTDQEILYPVTFEEEYIKITLSDKVGWEFIKDSMNDPYYARINLMDVFGSNASQEPNISLTEAFDISFSDNYYFNPYEGLCEGAESGIHIDILSDYSQNSVPKKNGIIHQLGEFDGLPTYFHSFHTENINRSHVELYTIRDRLNRYTQTPTLKQTAALILDSAMPQKDLMNIATEQEPAIVYQYDPEAYLFVTDPDKVVSKKNVVSEITFNDENTFGNCRRPADSKKKRFIYHGNRTFSLGAIEFDPELETARVYYINNDSISYVNNAASEEEKKRSPLTLARICDIPTTYEQLMHISNVAATYVFDSKYVRMHAEYNNDDFDLIGNKRRFKVVTIPGTTKGDTWIYDYRKELPSKQEMIDAGYYRVFNIYNTDIPITSENFEVLSSGNSYSEGDTFYCLVGGKAFDGVVTKTAMSGNVQEIEISVSDNTKISYYNTTGTDTSLKTVTVSSETGTGLQIKLVLEPGVIESHRPRKQSGDEALPPPEGLIAFKSDYVGNIFLYSLRNDWIWEKVCQVEGDEYRVNEYDSSATTSIRTFENTFKNYLLNAPSYTNDHIFFNPSEYIIEHTITDYQDAKGHKGDSETADLSEYIKGRNMPNTYYRLICTDGADNGHFDLKTYEMKNLDDFEAQLPRFNVNNTCKYFNPTNRLIKSDSKLNANQPSLFVYSPSHNTRIDGYLMPDGSNHMTDTLLITSKHKTNYNDYGSDIINSSGKLSTNVYYYPEYEFSDSYNEMREYLNTLQRSELITYIRDTLGTKSEPLKLEDSEYKYSHAELIEYIMDRYPSDGPYIKSGLKVHGYAGDAVIDKGSNNILGKPTTGGVIPLTTEMIDVSVNVDGKHEESIPANIFIIEDISFEGFSDDFRVHDENGIDISSTSIIIWKGNKYIFDDDMWVEIARSVIRGYYNPNDRMFYYNQQYSEIITPDVDFTYCDITTGQYYKWNGVNYVLIII